MRESIAICQSLPERGPAVITPTFVGYLVAGFWGSLLSTVGTFLPSFLLVLIVAPLGARHRVNANVQGFVKGALMPPQLGGRQSLRNLTADKGRTGYELAACGGYRVRIGPHTRPSTVGPFFQPDGP